jgi:hypothetical protein
MIRDFSNSSHIRVRKDYKRKLFEPSYTDDRPKRKLFDTTRYLKILGVLLVVYIIAYSDLTRIQAITISGTDMIAQSEIEQLAQEQMGRWRFCLLPQRNSIWLSKRQLRNEIESRYNLNKLEMDKGFRSLAITIEEKVTYLIINNQGKYYFSDDQGTITKEISQEEASRYWDRFPLIYSDASEIAIGHNIIKQKRVEFILKLHEALNQTTIHFSGYEVRGVDDIVMTSRDGWKAYFSPDTDPQLAVENLELILKEKIQDKNKLEYIDLRFGDKIFFK